MSSSSRVLVVGAGGHAKVVLATLQDGGWQVEGLLDDQEKLLGATVLGVPVVGRLAMLAERDSPRALIAIGDNRTRRNIAARFPGADWITAVHPRAYVHPTAHLGPGTVVFAGAVVQPEADVGEHSIINTGATVDHDCRLGPFVHVAPGAHLSGAAELGEGVLLAIGAVVGPGRRVGAWTTVGAGAAVVSDLPAGCTSVGVPAKPR